MNGERLVSGRRIRDAGFSDLDRREWRAERAPKIAKAVVAQEETIRQAARSTVELGRDRMQLVVHAIAGILERQAARVRPAAGVVEAQHERVRRQVALRVEIVVAYRERARAIDVPVELCEQLVVVSTVGESLVRPCLVSVGRETRTNRVHRRRIDARDAEASGAIPARHEVRSRILRPLDLAVDEEEQLVATDRTAERYARLVVAQARVRDHPLAAHA